MLAKKENCMPETPETEITVIIMQSNNSLAVAF